MAITTYGVPPKDFWERQRAKMIAAANETMADLESDLVQATPGDTGNLRQGWTFIPATEQKPIAIIGQSKRHFLPVEMGRRPGKGISAKGQESVARWGRRKLGMGDQEARSFAFLLSRKYKQQGRPAVGFAGLARPGSKAPNPSDQIEPLASGLIGQAFKKLRDKLDKI